MTEDKSTGGLDARFKTMEETSEKLKQLREARRIISGDMYTSQTEAQELLSKLSLDDSKEVVAGNLSKLEEGLAKYGKFETTIGELAAGLQTNLAEYVNFVSDQKNYQGFGENFLSMMSFDINLFGMKNKADKMRIQRMKTQKPKEILDMVQDYSYQLVEEILQVREDAIRTYQHLENSVDMITAKIEEFQPKEEMMKEKLTAMESQYATMKAEFDKANSTRQKDLAVEMADFHKTLLEVRNVYDDVLTKYNQAQQALRSNMESRNSFEQIQRDLNRQATMAKEKMDNMYPVFLAAAKAIETMEITKGMETMDKTVNTLANQCLDMNIAAAEAVNAATLAREETQIIEENDMGAYISRMETMFSDFAGRFDQLSKDARRSQEERYSKPAK